MIKLTKELVQLTNYLSDIDWISADERLLSTESPGAGNMNFTLRVKTNLRTFILKQSREYVEKYPQVPAPRDRSMREAEFYGLVHTNTKLSSKTPKIIQVDDQNFVLMLEDLGRGADFTYLYQQEEQLNKEELTELLDFVLELHQAFGSVPDSGRIRNIDMRQLNHEHIFVYPFMEDNGLDLEQIIPGLADVAKSLKKDTSLKASIKSLGELYLGDGDSLLHGDFFPGSWLRTAKGIYIIDPEFCFFGHREFELGVLVSHLKMSAHSPELVDFAIDYYYSRLPVDLTLVGRFAAIETIRRIIGLAQLPLTLDLGQRTALLGDAKNHLLD